MKTKQKSQFVPCYKVVIRYHNPSPYVDEIFVSYFDYFLRNPKGLSLFDFIEGYFAVPFEHTSINIFRCPR